MNQTITYSLCIIIFCFFNIHFKKCLGFTGVDQVYEKPDAPELVLKTIHLSVEESTMQVVQMLEENVSNFMSVVVDIYIQIGK